MDAPNFVCFWAEISGNLGLESSISGSKVLAQGPAIPKLIFKENANIRVSFGKGCTLQKGINHNLYPYIVTFSWLAHLKKEAY